jgi:hypothetical protein
MCCVVGSVVLVAAAWTVRAFRRWVLRRPPERPEQWRLPVETPPDAR